MNPERMVEWVSWGIWLAGAAALYFLFDFHFAHHVIDRLWTLVLSVVAFAYPFLIIVIRETVRQRIDPRRE